MNYNYLVAGLAVALLGGFVFLPQADAYRGDPSVQGPNFSTERHEAMQEAFANRDYNAWRELMADRGRVTQMITEENFDQFAQAHELAMDGKLDEAREIRQDLGLGMGGFGRGKGGSQGMAGGCNR